MFKKVIIGVGVIIVAVAVGVYYLSQNAGAIVKAAIEDQGSRATQVPVGVDAVNIDFTDLKAGLSGLSVGNPAGFKTDRAIGLGEISIKIAKDWSTQLIVIDEVMVNAPEVTYEIGTGGSNIAKIQENVDNFVKAMTGPDGGESAPSSSQEAEGPKIVINDLYIKNGKVNVSATMFDGSALSAPLPDIHLEDIGKDESGGGATPAQVVDELISAITEKAGGAASALDLSQIGLADISGKAAEIGAAAQEAAEGAVKQATEQLGGAGGAVEEQLGGAGEALGGAVKGLFGN